MPHFELTNKLIPTPIEPITTSIGIIKAFFFKIFSTISFIVVASSDPDFNEISLAPFFG